MIIGGTKELTLFGFCRPSISPINHALSWTSKSNGRSPVIETTLSDVCMRHSLKEAP